MAIRFAHMADIHLGAFRDERLRELNLNAFEKAIDICAQEELDFIVISGDLFHVNLPDMSIVNRAVQRMKELRDAGIRIYLVFGSHDYSAAGASLIDVLNSADLFTKVTVPVSGEDVEDKTVDRIVLDLVEDESGALLCGMPGRKSTLERKYYEMLDTGSLEKVKGFKIFAFHSGITENRPDYLPESGTIPLSLFPKGFDYYAGGHVHERMEMDPEGYGAIRFPGCLLGYNYSDLERGARNPRGIYIVEHNPDSGKTAIEFREVRVAGIDIVEVDCEKLEPAAANTRLQKEVGAVKASDKIVLLKVHGQLASGRASDIALNEVREGLDQSGAKAVFVNRNALKGAEMERIKVETGPKDEIEDKLFKEYIDAYDSADGRFSGEGGPRLCRDLFEIVRAPRPEGQPKGDYNKIILKKALPLFSTKGKKGGGG